MRKKISGIGLGLRAPYFKDLETLKNQDIGWLEILSENYFSGPALEKLEPLSQKYPLVMHGVSLSLGSSEALSKNYLKQLKKLIKSVEPHWISDHLCWTAYKGRSMHNLVPVPYTREVLHLVSEKIKRLQGELELDFLVENVSSYIEFHASEMKEEDFISELAERADCSLLLDINNVFVSACNHGFDPERYLKKIPGKRVKQMHLAGHSQYENYRLDTHDQPVAHAVWKLYQTWWPKLGKPPTMLEWDDRLPEFKILLREALKIKKYQQT